MTTKQPDKTKGERSQRFVLPDPPKRTDMMSFRHLTINGNAHYLALHLGNLDTTIVTGEMYLTSAPGAPARERVAPDLMVSFNADPAALIASNGYVISEQGKPPDLVLEIASRDTGRNDIREKRDWYAALGIPEYWRFDETGAYHRAKLGGDRLVNGEYQPIPIETLADGALQGYSPVLNLHLRWEQGQLFWYNPVTGRPIDTFQTLESQVEQERREHMRERQARLQAEQEHQAAQSRIRELEEQLRQRDQGPH